MKTEGGVVDDGGVTGAIDAVKLDFVIRVFENVNDGSGTPSIEVLTESVDGVTEFKPRVKLKRKLGPDVSDVNIFREALRESEVLEENKVFVFGRGANDGGRVV